MSKALIALCMLVGVGLLVAFGLPLLRDDGASAEVASLCAAEVDPRERDICLEDAAKHFKANGSLGVAPAAEQN
ncbi:hypothetical protein IB229_12950 [Pseudomonas sp. PDM14]|uniref:hypothetical protein n=1 Tax=Pseudomonas sp. PDM14 TaxID=2769288 RepID=UPI00177F085A|nr:hypothetical protein [Pseudomonas sp. PDM14]MBD9483887.1 hypothetical protein [Pseudomonas sp. PDM14]